MKKINIGIFLAILAAGLYAINAPLSKIMLDYIPPTLMAGFLYLGAGLGMVIISLIRKLIKKEQKELKLTKQELPYTLLMIMLDIIAPICLLFGLKYTTSENVSLLNNFEIVVTAIVAFIIFKEKISKRLMIGILFVFTSCLILSIEDISSFTFSKGSIFVILACIAWGFENNCTRKMSSKDPLQIVLLKGIFSGLGSIIIGLIIGEKINNLLSILIVLVIGFIAYGLSIFFYVYAQRLLGAARTSAYYAISPFIGVVLSFIIFKDIPYYVYFIALGLMIIGAILCANDEPLFNKKNKFKKAS